MASVGVAAFGRVTDRRSSGANTPLVYYGRVRARPSRSVTRRSKRVQRPAHGGRETYPRLSGIYPRLLLTGRLSAATATGRDHAGKDAEHHRVAAGPLHAPGEQQGTQRRGDTVSACAAPWIRPRCRRPKTRGQTLKKSTITSPPPRPIAVAHAMTCAIVDR